jgi:hypothetical protein
MDVYLHSQSQRKRRLSCSSDLDVAGEATFPSLKRPRHDERTSSRVWNWLGSVAVKHGPNELHAKRARSASLLSHLEEPWTSHTRRARSAPAPDDRDLLQPSSKRQDRSISMRDGSSIPDGAQADNESQKSSSSRSTRLVATPYYRTFNCEPNGVVYQEPSYQLPPALSQSISRLYRERQSPQPDFANDEDLVGIESAPETAVASYYNAKIFTHFSGVRRDDGLPMNSTQVPGRTQANTKLSRPTPDALYGYPSTVLGSRLTTVGTTALANSTALSYPFLAIEYKADGPTGAGSLWVATNQCLGDASTCVNIANNLNTLLRQGSPEISQIDEHAFSVACDGSQARLLVSWKAENQEIYTRKFGHFLTQDPEQIKTFRTVCRNIIDWGRTVRLRQICDGIDALAEQSRLAHTAAAKLRPPPHSEEPQRLSKSACTSTSLSDKGSAPRSQTSPSARSSKTSQSRPPVAAPPWLWSDSYEQYYYVRGREYVFQDGSTKPIG